MAGAGCGSRWLSFHSQAFCKVRKIRSLFTAFCRCSSALVCQIASGFFKLCKRHWNERNFQLAKRSAWLLRSLQCLLQSSKHSLAIYCVFWWHAQLLCQIASGFSNFAKGIWVSAISNWRKGQLDYCAHSNAFCKVWKIRSLFTAFFDAIINFWVK